ncbi:hypothetical protein EXS73_02280 [Candidatus Pacearchaeota archaeon]|nr:hypothetical protein [Candidatus Pacearchaeota archaeon]
MGDGHTHGPVHKHSFYGGSLAGIDEQYGSPIDQSIPTRSIALTTNPQTANQLREVMNQLNTGARAIEVTLLTPQVSEAIPNQHLDEIKRLSRLVGAELNVHGVLVEPTGISDQGRWDEQKRVQAERQMWNAMEQAHRISPDRNVVVTFHSSNGLPEPETREKIQNKETGKWEEIVTGIGVADELNGSFGVLPAKIKPNYFTDEQATAQSELEKYNKEQWSQQVANTNIELNRIAPLIQEYEKLDKDPEKAKSALKLFKLARTNPEEYQSIIQKEEQANKQIGGAMKQQVQELNYADSLTKDSYRSFQKLFNDAYNAADRTIAYERFAKTDEEKKQLENAQKDKISLEKLKKEIAPLTKAIAENPEKVFELAEHIQKGMQVLGSLAAPQMIRPLRQFALDKSSETFSNLALQAYQQYEDKAPVISIENPPVGMGMSRAQDIRDMVELSQEKFADKLQKEEGLSKEQAQTQARKLIGATWDVGHINMLKKRGYTDKEIVAETEIIAKHVKNIHMSDNFGLDHTELPMGMGNVPMQGHLAKLKAEHGKKLDDIKKIVETGHWYTHFKTTPFAETLSQFGSPIYGMNMSPYWNQGHQQAGGYFAGYGTNPDTHHSIYGAGFSSLPVELGGNIQGKSRLSGAPIE